MADSGAGEDRLQQRVFVRIGFTGAEIAVNKVPLRVVRRPLLGLISAVNWRWEWRRSPNLNATRKTRERLRANKWKSRLPKLVELVIRRPL